MQAAIVGLVKGHNEFRDYSYLIYRNYLIHRNFNRKFCFPIIIFHEGNILPEHQRVISRMTPNVSFYDVSGKAFVLPKNITTNAEGGIKDIGYKHMCRFYAMQIYDLVKGFDYILRLDEDSFIDSSIPYDIFSFMQEHDLIYGYVHKENDYHEQTVATLPSFTKNYILKNNVKIVCPLTEINELCFYSNFTLTQVAFWHRPEVKKYLQAIDESMGIYRFRWGDHVIQALAIKMFCDDQQVHFFQDFKYSHQSHEWSNYGKKFRGFTYFKERFERRSKILHAQFLMKNI